MLRRPKGPSSPYVFINQCTRPASRSPQFLLGSGIFFFCVLIPIIILSTYAFVLNSWRRTRNPSSYRHTIQSSLLSEGSCVLKCYTRSIKHQHGGSEQPDLVCSNLVLCAIMDIRQPSYLRPVRHSPSCNGITHANFLKSGHAQSFRQGRHSHDGHFSLLHSLH